MSIVKKGNRLNCPHCKAEQDDGPVEDFVVPGHVGVASAATTDCVDCYAHFEVRYLGNDDYEVTT